VNGGGFVGRRSPAASDRTVEAKALQLI